MEQWVKAVGFCSRWLCKGEHCSEGELHLLCWGALVLPAPQRGAGLQVNFHLFPSSGAGGDVSPTVMFRNGDGWLVMDAAKPLNSLQ